MSTANCYCGLWDTAPETLRKQGVPAGFCGICSICGQPGHTRAHPRAPVSDAWCDTCYVALESNRVLPWPQLVTAALVLIPFIAVMWRLLA